MQDYHGIYKGSVQAKGKKILNALESELQAILMALQHCWIQGHIRRLQDGNGYF